MGDDEGDCTDYIHIGAHAQVVERPDDYEVDIRCYTVVTAGALAIQVFGFVAAGNDTRQVSAVTVVVIQRKRGSVLNGIVISNDPFVAVSVVSNCVVAPGSRIDQSNGDTGSGDAFKMQLVSIDQCGIERIATLSLHRHVGVMSKFQGIP